MRLCKPVPQLSRSEKLRFPSWKNPGKIPENGCGTWHLAVVENPVETVDNSL